MSNKMKNKLTALCDWLRAQGIDDYIEDMRDESGVRIDLFLPTQNIAVHLSDGKNQLFYRRTCTEYRPFFIRSFETDDFVIEKMRNCIEGYTCKTAPKRKKSERPMIKKRQRIMVNAQRVRKP